ncbi:hypothetical protein SCYAM73S_06579 [Streptomyces cyaneofuscatus]
MVTGQGHGERPPPLLPRPGRGEAVVQHRVHRAPAPGVLPRSPARGRTQGTGQLGAEGGTLLEGEREDVQRQPGQRHRSQVDVRPLSHGVGAQPLQPGHPGRGPLQEHLALHPVPGREPLRDGERQLGHGPLLVVRAPPGVQQRVLVARQLPRPEQERPDLGERLRPLRAAQMDMAGGRLHPAPVLHRVVPQIGPGRQPVTHDRPGAPVVDPGPAHLAEEAVDPLRRQPRQPRGDQPALGAPLLGARLARGSQEAEHDAGGIVVVDVEGQRSGVQTAVVDPYVSVQEVQRQLLVEGARTEFALSGRGDRRIREEQDVFGGDEIGGVLGRTHGLPPVRSADAGRGMEARTTKSSLHRQVPVVAAEVPRPAPET